MNLKNIKKINRISKKIFIKKLINKVNNKILDKLYCLRDNKVSTYSYDYVSYFRTEYKNSNIINSIYNIKQENKLTEFVEYCSQHSYKVLSSNFQNVNSDKSINEIQKNFNPKLVPFSSKCYNLISDNYTLINWQKDINNGYEWQWNWYKNIRYGNNNGADIKVPWELGRMQHLPILAFAFTLTEDDKIKVEIRDQIFDFMATNPPNFGVQWMTSMDIGIRMINWLFALQIIRNHSVFNDSEMELIDSYLYDHYLHIKNNIELSEGMRGNHYLSNLCSIVIYLLFVRDENNKSSLITKYINLINTELDYQFYNDGTNFEQSTRYHIFTSQMLITADILLKKLYSKELNQNRMNKICSFSQTLLKYDFPPQIGDNDSGYYWKLYNDEKLTYNCLSEIIKNEYLVDSINNYIDFGYIERRYDNIDLIFKCGQVGQYGKGGHDHNDNLSYNIYYFGIPFIVDIGTYCYTNNYEKRNYYRATAQHNVMQIGEFEQNEYSASNKDDMFWLDTDNSSPKLIKYEQNKIAGTINYCGIQYQREIEYISDEIIVTDKYNNSIDKKIQIHFPHNANIINVENSVYKVCIDEKCIIIDFMGHGGTIEDYMFSPSYGVEYNAKMLVISSDSKEIRHKIRKGNN